MKRTELLSSRSLYRLFITIVFCLFAVNIGIFLFILKDYRVNRRETEQEYFQSIRARMDYDLNSRIPEITLSLFQPSEYNRYIDAFQSAEKNVLYVQLYRELQRILYSTGGIYMDCSIYYPQTQEIISASHGYLQLGRERNQEYRSIYNIEMTEQYQYGINIAETPSNDSGILLNVSYRFANGTVIIYNLGQSYFNDLFMGDFAGQQTEGVFLLNLQNRIIYKNGAFPAGWLDSSDFSDNLIRAVRMKELRINHGDVKMILTGTTFEEFQFQIVTIRQEAFLPALKNYALLLICFIFLLLTTIVAGKIIPGHLVRKIYRPLNTMAEHIQEDSVPSGESPLQVIEKYIADSKTELKEMKQLLKSSKSTIQESFIKYLIKNASPDSKTIQEYGTVLDFDPYIGTGRAACLLLDSIALKNFTFAEQVLLKIHLIFEIERSVSEKSPSSLHIRACDYSDNSIAMILQEEQSGDIDPVPFLESVIGDFLSRYDIRYFLSLGSVQDSPEKLSTSFLTARTNSASHFFFPPDVHSCRVDMQDPSEARSPAFQMLAESSPGTADIAVCVEALKKYFLHFHSAPVFSQCKKALVLFSQFTVKILEQNEACKNPDFLHRIMYPFDCFWNVWDYLEFIQGLLTADRDSGNVKRTEEISNRINRYIDAHLKDMISLEDLASHVNLSPKYLSKIYKEQTGRNLSAHISEKRLEKAAELLRYTNKNIKTIAEETGFSSSNYFIKCFQAKFGMTPKAWREHFSAPD